MAIDPLVKPFLHLPLFNGLKPLQLTEIVRRADRIIFRAGDTIISEDQVGDAAIVIVSGESVRTSSSEPGTAAEAIPEGSMIGELAMLIEIVHSSTVVARGSVKALRLTREEMQTLMAEDPSLAEHFSSKIGARLGQFLSDLNAVNDALEQSSAEDFGDLMPSQGARPESSIAMH